MRTRTRIKTEKKNKERIKIWNERVNGTGNEKGNGTTEENVEGNENGNGTKTENGNEKWNGNEK